MIKPTLKIGPNAFAVKNNKILGFGEGDTSGEFVAHEMSYFSGSDLTRSRINKEGNVEWTRKNELLQSNSFDNASWTKVTSSDGDGTTVTSGQSGYDGTTNAWLLSKTKQKYGGVNQSISLTGAKTFSVYVKAGTTNHVRLYTGGYVYFDLSSESVGAKSGIVDASIESVGDGWYRLSVIDDETTTVVKINPAIADGDLGSDRVDGGTGTGSVYIQDAQLEWGFSATKVITSGSSAGTLGLEANEPAIDYGGSDKKAKLLGDPTRTNYIQYSEGTEDVSSQGQPAVAITLVQDEVNPTGYKGGVVKVKGFGGTSQNSDRFKAEATILPSDSANNQWRGYVCSMWVKGTSGEKINYNAKRFGSGGDAFGAATTHTFSGEWERIDDVFVATSTDPNDPDAGNTKGGMMLVNIVSGEKRSTASEFLTWGYQVERVTGTTAALAKAFGRVSSYIPNYGKSAGQERLAERMRQTDVNDTGLIFTETGNGEGTLFVDIENLNNNSVQWHVAKNDNSEAIRIYINQNDQLNIFKRRNNTQSTVKAFTSTNVTDAGGTAIDSDGRSKVAISWKGTDLKVAINGAAFDSTTTVAVPAIDSEIAPALNTVERPNHTSAMVSTNELHVYDKQLTLSELETLTAI